jgi:hypothetical protein
MFLESPHQGLSKNISHTPFSWRPNGEKIQSPSNNGGVLNGNQMFSVTIIQSQSNTPPPLDGN